VPDVSDAVGGKHPPPRDWKSIFIILLCKMQSWVNIVRCPLKRAFSVEQRTNGFAMLWIISGQLLPFILSHFSLADNFKRLKSAFCLSNDNYQRLIQADQRTTLAGV
jgi:hypothetical protein